MPQIANLQRLKPLELHTAELSRNIEPLPSHELGELVGREPDRVRIFLQLPWIGLAYRSNSTSAALHTRPALSASKGKQGSSFFVCIFVVSLHSGETTEAQRPAAKTLHAARLLGRNHHHILTSSLPPFPNSHQPSQNSRDVCQYRRIQRWGCFLPLQDAEASVPSTPSCLGLSKHGVEKRCELIPGNSVGEGCAYQQSRRLSRLLCLALSSDLEFN